MKNPLRLLHISKRHFTESIADYRVIGSSGYDIPERFMDGLDRMASGLLGRLGQKYPGEFMEQVEHEISIRYPRYNR